MPERPKVPTALHAVTPSHEAHRGKMSLGMVSGASVADVLDLIAASHLAANGDIDEAEMLLSLRVSSSTPSTTLDMLARVMIRKGEFEKARQLWLTILERDPENQAAKSALSRLRTPWLAMAVAKRICILAAISLGVTLAIIGLFALSGLRFYQDGPPVSLSKVEPVGASSLTAPESHAVAFPTNTHAPAVSEQASSAPWEHPRRRMPPLFAVSGATVTTNLMETQVVFHEGLFPYRCEFAQSARLRLEEAGRAIAEHAPDCWVIVEGHTDSDPLPASSPFKDNYTLAMHRALAAVEVLKTTPIPTGDILIASAGNLPSIFPGGDYDTKVRNRTVVIRLLPKTTTDERAGEDPL